MALGASATMAFLFLFSLVAVARCGALQEELTTDASSFIPAKVRGADPDAEGLLRLPSSDAALPMEETAKPVAEPDPDRSSHQDSDVAGVAEEETVKPVAEPDPDRSHEDDRKEDKKKTKKHHGCDDKGRKEKAKKHQHRQSDNEDKEEEITKKKRIHRHNHDVESEKKKNKWSHHIKNINNVDDDSDDEDEEKKAKLWRKAVKNRFGHGRRSQREESNKDKVNN